MVAPVDIAHTYISDDAKGAWGMSRCRQVYGNEIVFAEAGSIKVQIDNQGLICGNICEDGACEVEG